MDQQENFDDLYLEDKTPILRGRPVDEEAVEYFFEVLYPAVVKEPFPLRRKRSE